MDSLRSFLHDESGQAMFEFLFLLLAVVSIAGMMKVGLREMTGKFWLALAKRIAAPCPTCAASDDVAL